jgi:Tol biopolymer transport system component
MLLHAAVAVVTAGCSDPAAPATELRSGEYIYFSGRAFPREWDIMRIRPDGTGREVLTDYSGDDDFPSVAPDGRTVAFHSTRSPEGIYLLNLASRSVTRLSWLTGQTGPVRITWSRDQSRIAVDDYARGEVIVAKPDGSSRATLGIGNWAAISPDGRRVAFIAYDGTQVPRLVVVNSDGTGRREIATHAIQPAWSPDGGQIVFTRQVEARAGRGNLYIIGADGSNERALTAPVGLVDDGTPAWSPDGQWIAFGRSTPCPTADPCSSADVYVIRLDGTTVRNVTQGIGDNWMPSW